MFEFMFVTTMLDISSTRLVVYMGILCVTMRVAEEIRQENLWYCLRTCTCYPRCCEVLLHYLPTWAQL